MKDSAEFERDWLTSHLPVFDVALALRRRGLELRIPVPMLRADEAERWKFVDDGDIECIKIIQVKQRHLDFTSADDFPFGTIYLDETYKVDDKLPRLMGYAVVNHQRTHMAWIQISTKKDWTVVDVPDSKQGRVCRTYACPKALARFVKLGA